MAEQWNTITTIQVHTGNSQFKFVKLKRGSHLSRFWHTEGHKYLQRDASHISALIQGVLPADVSSVRPPAPPPCSCPTCPSSSWPPAAPSAAAPPAAPQFLHPSTGFPPLPPPPPGPLCSLLKRSQEQSRVVRLASKKVNADPIMIMLGCKLATELVCWWILATFLKSARKV